MTTLSQPEFVDRIVLTWLSTISEPFGILCSAVNVAYRVVTDSTRKDDVKRIKEVQRRIGHGRLAGHVEVSASKCEKRTHQIR